MFARVGACLVSAGVAAVVDGAVAVTFASSGVAAGVVFGGAAAALA